MRHHCLIALLGAVLMAATASAQNNPPRPSPPAPYKAVTITLPKPVDDPSFEAFRKEVATAAAKKNRAALGKLVAPQGFFWDRENGDGADKKKSGLDNLTTALGLARAGSAGWDMLASYAEEPTAAANPQRGGAICAPADPAFDGKAFDALLEATKTDPGEWGFPVADGVEVRGAPQANAPVTGKLTLALVRVAPEAANNVPSFLRVITPAGKAGYVQVDSIAPLGNDQLCYAKAGGAWRIIGYIGGGEPQ
ncbi:MAG TPA: hypothetical protein VN655_07525 [Pseudolabrys sp.]|nr:hypothetical protein [Pseudolabrys sp.]